MTLFSGIAIFKMANILNTPAPFQFNSSETIVLLLIVAPVLEELVFRFGLWEGLKKISENPWALVALSSLFFSMGHFLAFWDVADSFKGFVVYQTVYTFLLALGLGFLRFKSNGLAMPITVHFIFNLGFFAGSFV